MIEYIFKAHCSIAQRVLLDCQMKVENDFLLVYILNSSKSLQDKNITYTNGTAPFKKCKQLIEYQHLLFLRDTCGLYYKRVTIVIDAPSVISK